MRAVLLDTNVWSWTLLGHQRLSRAAQAANDAAPNRYLSPISLYEVSHKAKLGKWPEMVGVLPQLRDIAMQQGLAFTRLDDEVCLRAGMLDWSHLDPFDRMLAATALIYNVPIVSSDRAFDDVVSRIW